MQYPTTAIIEVHHAGKWHPAAELHALGHNRVRFNYLDEYVFGDINLPLSLTMPVGLWPEPKVEGPMGPQSDWKQVIDQLEIPDDERASIAAELAEFAKTVGRLDVIARDCGVEQEVLGQCLKSIEAQARQLEDF